MKDVYYRPISEQQRYRETLNRDVDQLALAQTQTAAIDAIAAQLRKEYVNWEPALAAIEEFRKRAR